MKSILSSLSILTIYIFPLMMALAASVLVSSIVRFTPVANRGRRDLVTSIKILLVLGATSFLIVFVLIALLSAGLDYFSCWHSVDNYGKGRLQANTLPIFVELVIRKIVPPLLGHFCYSDDVYICTVADAASLTSQSLHWIWRVLVSLFAASATIIMGRFWIRHSTTPGAANEGQEH